MSEFLYEIMVISLWYAAWAGPFILVTIAYVAFRQRSFPWYWWEYASLFSCCLSYPIMDAVFGIGQKGWGILGETMVLGALLGILFVARIAIGLRWPELNKPAAFVLAAIAIALPIATALLVPQYISD
jgi:hypothetical protein